MFSIIIPLYNKENSIKRTIDSVLKQTLIDYEIIIVDDGSTDSSLNIVMSFNDSRIRIIRQENAGVSAARNKGIREAKGDYIAFLDADDEWDEEYLEQQLLLITKYGECDVFGVNYRFEDYNGLRYSTILNNLPFEYDSDGVLTNYFEVASNSHVPVCTSSVVVRRNAILSINGFPVGIKSGEDLLTWARLALKHEIAYSRIPRATYHLDEGYEYGCEPVRRQDPGDPVGKELVRLLSENPDVRGLKAYISHWHKMRASVAIRFGERRETLKECLLSLKFNPTNFKIYPFILLALMPSSLRNRIIRMKKH